jgi:hypothetical protein
MSTHLFVSLALFIWQAPRPELGLPVTARASALSAILCFPLILLGNLDAFLPQRFRVPEFLYPVVWCISSALWGIVVAAICLSMADAARASARLIR